MVTTPTTPANAPAGEQLGSSKLTSLREDLAKILGKYFFPLLIVTMFFAVFLIFIIGTKRVTEDTAEKMALAASVQVAFGMVIGYVCVYIGLMMTWLGIESSTYQVRGSGGTANAKAEASLSSASPGLLFALGGMILIAVCLYKPIEYKAKVPITVQDIPDTPPEIPAGDQAPGLTPNPLPPPDA